MNKEIEEIDGEVVETTDVVPAGGIVGQIDRAQVDVQIATAKKYPRSVDKAMKEAVMLATADEVTAQGMNYTLPRQTQDGKKIQGPSVRLAEIMAYAWGNLRVEADIVDIDGEFVTAMGTCFDLERNVAVRVRAKRRITDKHGKRYGADMIGVTSNAAIAIAFRNAVFKVIPRAYANRVYQAAMKTAVGDEKSFKVKRDAAIEWFEKNGIKKAQVFELLGVRGIDDIGADELIQLFGMKTAIEDGDTTVAQILQRMKGESDEAAELKAATQPKPTTPTPAAAPKAEAAKPATGNGGTKQTGNAFE